MKDFFEYKFDVFEISLCCHLYSDASHLGHKDRASHGLVFIKSGDSEYTFQDGTTLSVCDNDLFYLPKGSTYNFILYKPCECYVINFQLSSDKVFDPFSIKVKNKINCFNFFSDANNAWRKQNNGFEEQCLGDLYLLLSLIKKERATTYLPESKVLQIESAIDYIKEHYAEEKIEIPKLAKLCNISETYFRTIFKTNFGVSPVKYINMLKIERAKSFLRSGIYSVSESGMLSGFSEECIFSREFKKAVGVTPTKYKENINS